MNERDKQGRQLQVVGAKRKRSDRVPQVPSVRRAIYLQWRKGVDTARIADRFSVRAVVINTVAREESERVRVALLENRAA